MQVENFAVIGGDLRSSYLAGSLAADGFRVITAGFDHVALPPCVTGCTNTAQAMAMAECVVLPMPVSTDGSLINAPFSRVRITLDEVLGSVRPGQLMLGGAVSGGVEDALRARGLVIHDYLKREELATLNAVPTAEGAIYTAMGELPITMMHARVMIAGYGRIGKALARLLVAMGARVTVAARDCAELALAGVSGCETAEMERLGELGPFDVVFNTAPAPVFSRRVLETMDKNTLLIDLASRPGGVDFAAAAALRIKTIWALSLPGKVAPKSAGEIIKSTILNMLTEL